MIATMAQAGKNKGNKNAALKPGEIGRIQFTYSLSGDALQQFVCSLNLNPSQMSEQELREYVVAAAREKIQDMFNAL